MDFQQLLADRGICVYDVEDLEQDVQRLRDRGCLCSRSRLRRKFVVTNTAALLQQERGLDAGESNAIALTFELQADDLGIDERLGRQKSIRLGLSIIGILGILFVAKQRSLIPQVQSVMHGLINQPGFRVSPQLYQRILALAQEP